MTCDPVMALLGIYPKKIEVQTKIYIYKMFTTVSFVMAKIGKANLNQQQ